MENAPMDISRFIFFGKFDMFEKSLVFIVVLTIIYMHIHMYMYMYTYTYIQYVYMFSTFCYGFSGKIKMICGVFTIFTP